MTQPAGPERGPDDTPRDFETILAATGTEAPESPKGARRWAMPRGRTRVLGVLLVGTALAGLGWTLLGPSGAPVGPEDVPLVLAEDTPTKERPAEPGGITIPNQDTLVYGLIEPTRQDGEVVERLLPPPEEPLAIAPPPAEPVVVPQPEPESAPAATIGQVLEDTAEPTVEAADQAAELADVAPAAGTEEPAPPEATFEDEVGAAVSALEAEPAEPEPASSRIWRVQVGAVKDEAQVDPEWRRLKGKLGDLVSGLGLTVETADLGSGQGLYHRLQLGAFADRGGAEALCAELKARGVDCLVVRR